MSSIEDRISRAEQGTSEILPPPSHSAPADRRDTAGLAYFGMTSGIILHVTLHGIQQLVVLHVPDRLSGRTPRDDRQVGDKLAEPDVWSLVDQFEKGP